MATKVKQDANILTPAQEEMRKQVVDLELKARYWKAQYDIRHFTLESEALQEKYDAYIEETRKAGEEAYKNLMAEMEKVKAEQEEVVDNGNG